MQDKNCIFCKIVKKEIPSELVEESKNFVAFLDVNPKTSGHTLIIPKQHFTNLMDMPAELGNEMLEMAKDIAERRIAGGAEGINLIMNNNPAAGQVVMHAHLHLLPRKKGDGLRMVV